MKCRKKGFFVFWLNPGTFQFFPTHIINQRRWRENITWMNGLWKLELWTRYFHSSSLLVVKAYEGLRVCCLVRSYKNFDIGIHCTLISFVMIKKRKLPYNTYFNNDVNWLQMYSNLFWLKEITKEEIRLSHECNDWKQEFLLKIFFIS